MISLNCNPNQTCLEIHYGFDNGDQHGKKPAPSAPVERAFYSVFPPEYRVLSGIVRKSR
jgi:hypothetical protein